MAMPPPAGPSTVAFIALALTVGACTAVNDLVNPPKPVVVELQVWNRTLDPIFLINQQGQRLDVPACGHAIAERFQVNRVEVRTEQGFYFGSGTTGAGDAGRPQSMVITSKPGDSRDAVDPAALPPCEGHPEVQPGVTFRAAE
jgi:hypothetical protein